MIIRRENKINVIDTNHLIIHDITKTEHIHTQLNLNHHNEIINKIYPTIETESAQE
jgi:hypothetical protein